MDLEAFSSTRLLIFVLLTLANLIYSWVPLRNPRSHGFYRFFIFEAVIIQAVINGLLGPAVAPPWFEPLSQLLRNGSILLVITGYYQLRRHGGHEERADFPENHHFENTSSLVTRGIYRYIRHPMYSALLLLTWGIYLGYPKVVGLSITLFTMICILVAARVEEKENIAYFGDEYRAYMKATKKFIPYIV